MRNLSSYLWWKSQLSRQKAESRSQAMPQSSNAGGNSSGPNKDQGISAALRRKDKVLADKANSRRRIRGGATASTSTRAVGKSVIGNIQGVEELQEEADQIADL